MLNETQKAHKLKSFLLNVKVSAPSTQQEVQLKFVGKRDKTTATATGQ